MDGAMGTELVRAGCPVGQAVAVRPQALRSRTAETKGGRAERGDTRTGIAVRDGSCETIAGAVLDGSAQRIVVEFIAIAIVAPRFRLRRLAAVPELGVELPDASKRLGVELAGPFRWSGKSGIDRRSRRSA